MMDTQAEPIHSPSNPERGIYRLWIVCQVLEQLDKDVIYKSWKVYRLHKNGRGTVVLNSSSLPAIPISRESFKV